MNAMFHLQFPSVDSHYQILFVNVGSEILTAVWVIPAPYSSISLSSYLARHRGIFSKRTMGDYARKLSLSSHWYLSTTNNDDRTLYRGNNSIWIFLLLVYGSLIDSSNDSRKIPLPHFCRSVTEEKSIAGIVGNRVEGNSGDKLPRVSFLFEIRREICPLLSTPVLINRQIRSALTCN